MKITITPKPVEFEAAHTLPQFCALPHGHSYSVTVTVTGPVKNGAIVDWWGVRAIVKRATEDLDHRMLNDVIDNPTGERVAIWLFEHVRDRMKVLYPSATLESLRLSEGRNMAEVFA